MSGTGQTRKMYVAQAPSCMRMQKVPAGLCAPRGSSFVSRNSQRWRPLNLGSNCRLLFGVIFHKQLEGSIFSLRRMTVAWLKVMWKQLLMNNGRKLMPVCYANWRDSVDALRTLTVIARAQLGLQMEWDLLCLFIRLCVSRCVWTMSNSPDKIIPGIPGLNLSLKLRVAAPSFFFPPPSLVVFPGLVLNVLFFFLFVCFVFVKMVWISDVLPHYGLAKYHLAESRMRQNISKMDYCLLIIICPFMFLQSWITQKANLFDLKRCQFNVSFVSLLSPFVLFFGPVCGQVLHTNQRCPSSCCPYTR